jgi:hypothetical protein
MLMPPRRIITLSEEARVIRLRGCIMSSKFGSPVDRRRVVLGIAAGAAGIASPAVLSPSLAAPGLSSPVVPSSPAAESDAASSAAAGNSNGTYTAFFLGQGGYYLSWGVPYLAYRANSLGGETEIFAYSEVREAWNRIVRKKRDGYKVALVGYSLGNTTATYLQTNLPVELLLAISESSLGRNHRIDKNNTKRAALWYGPGFLSNAGQHDGFDKTTFVESVHIFMDFHPHVVNGVLDELKHLA